MATGTRVPFEQAALVAADLIGYLAGAVLRAEVAGSIRRKAPDVGDIELVAVPRTHTETIPGLLEDDIVEVDDLQLRIDELLERGTLAKHPTDPKRGPKYSKLLDPQSGLQVDLFSARAHTFGVILLIRTGPASYSKELVTVARKRGHHVAEGELHVGAFGCSATPCEVVPTPEEADVYRALRTYHLPPEDRR